LKQKLEKSLKIGKGLDANDPNVPAKD